MKMGTLAAQVAGSTVARRIGGAFKTEEERAEASRTALLDSAQKVVRTMGEMKGAAMKLGQMLSVAPDALPREFLEELRSLQKDSPAMPYEMVAAEIEKGLSRSLVDVFRYFDPKPIGAASIGQVHRARLFDGRDVAVKVQYPGIAATLDSDIKNLASMIQLGRVVADKGHLEKVIDEIRSGLLEEADYEHEAQNLRKYGRILREHPRIVVPEVIEEASSRSVLTMSFVEGTKLDLAMDALPAPEKDRVALDFSETIVWMFHAKQVLHADPHPGNYLYTADDKFAFLDFGCFREFDADFTDGFLDVLVAKWKHEKARLPAIHDRLGFKAMGNAKPLDADQLHEITEIALSPFLYDREFDWGTWSPNKPMEQFVKNNLGVLRYAAPPKALFYVRVCGGIWGFLQRCKARGNWYRMAQGMARQRGLM